MIIIEPSDYLCADIRLADREGDEVVGSVDVDFYPPWVMLWALWVAPDYRRQGRATALILEAARQAQTRDKATLELNVFTNNTAAINLYRKLGFYQLCQDRNTLCMQARVDQLLAREQA